GKYGRGPDGPAEVDRQAPARDSQSPEGTGAPGQPPDRAAVVVGPALLLARQRQGPGRQAVPRTRRPVPLPARQGEGVRQSASPCDLGRYEEEGEGGRVPQRRPAVA